MTTLGIPDYLESFQIPETSPNATVWEDESVKHKKLKKVGDIRYERKRVGGRWTWDTFDLSKHNWSGGKAGEEYDKESIPFLNIWEFQPRRGYIWDIKPHSFEKLVSELIEPGTLLGAGVRYLAAGAKGNIGGIDFSAMSPIDQETKVLNKWFQGTELQDDGLGFAKNLLSGEYVGQYKIPFLSNDFLQADFTDGWSGGGAEKKYGGKLSKILQSHYGVNFPLAPTWSLPQGGVSTKTHSYDFYLFNYDTTDYNKNIKFLESFVSGNLWVQMGTIQQSPNLYHVHCPGRFRYYFASIGTTVTYEGKTRNLLNEKYETVLVPEAFKVSIVIKDMTPNNYNAFINNVKKTDDPNISSDSDNLDVYQTVGINDTNPIANLVSSVEQGGVEIASSLMAGDYGKAGNQLQSIFGLATKTAKDANKKISGE